MNSNKTLKIKWCEMILYEGLLYSIERANRRNNSIYPTSKNENQ